MAETRSHVSMTPKLRAYLVSVRQWLRRERVYAVLAANPDEAIEAVALTVAPGAKIAIVGGFSRDLARRLELKAGELRLI